MAAGCCASTPPSAHLRRLAAPFLTIDFFPAPRLTPHPPPRAHRLPPDEHCDIREWVLHHASLGVRRFYVWDTQSAPPMRGVLEDLVASGLVAYEYLADPAELGLPPPTPGRSHNWQVRQG